LAAADPVKLAEAKLAAKKAKLQGKDEDGAKGDDAPIDGDDDTPQLTNTGISHLNPKTDFQLARAIDVLKAGSVAEAIKLYPSDTYSQTKPRFTTASIAPAPGQPAKTESTAKPVDKSKSR
jgi:hypothetical protein